MEPVIETKRPERAEGPPLVMDSSTARMYRLLVAYFCDGFALEYIAETNTLRFTRGDFWESVIQLDVWFKPDAQNDIIDLILPAL